MLAGEDYDVVFGEDGDDRVAGQGGNDLIHGGRGNDRLNGGGGNDTLAGEDGNDRLFGMSGNDEMIGGAGDDIYVVDANGDVLDILVQPQRNAKASRRFLARLVDRFGEARIVVTDKLRSGFKPVWNLAPGADHRAHMG